jgi:hypothetical protein
MTSPANMPAVVTPHRRGRRKPCSRDGCPRFGKSDRYCSKMSRDLDTEFDRLQELYATAGDPTLSRDAWLALSSVSDEWTEFISARMALRQEIRDAGLQLP